MDGPLQHEEAVIEVEHPEGLAEFGECVTTPDIIDENIESLVAPFDMGGYFSTSAGLM